MLVDLARNDLSRSAEKVKVDTYAETQYYSHVIHMVSKVTGALLEGKIVWIFILTPFQPEHFPELQNIEPYRSSMKTSLVNAIFMVEPSGILDLMVV